MTRMDTVVLPRSEVENLPGAPLKRPPPVRWKQKHLFVSINRGLFQDPPFVWLLCERKHSHQIVAQKSVILIKEDAEAIAEALFGWLRRE